ncbi:MAG: hypothetical protein ACRDS0_08110 [Pseudonocardiaceae bacterium]
MSRHRTIIRAFLGATMMAGGMVALTPAAQATIPVACDENALVAAINQANSTPSADTLTLASGCTYRMTSSHGSRTDGPDALPIITTAIDLVGPATITRDSAQAFRIAEVSATGKLTLTGIALTNGSANGDGGAILNRGSVTLTDSSISGNSANNGGGLANPNTLSGTAPTATFTRSPVSSNTARYNGGGIFNGIRSTLTTTGVSGTPLLITGNTAQTGGGIVAFYSGSTTLTRTSVTANHAGLTTGGVYRQGGAMANNSSTISANTPTNCAGSSPAVPGCTG